ncbi:nitrate reductase [Salinigranum rubrum]|uniref:Nitrate reductase n=1 Tax=Salinigranum rubrum TaxID=755307 RepID=A0A2I8VQ89_9EURY|nr:assimilatory nitrate reductase NasA [Salinigranum rubrum]AUV84044.1 nitrate reductase [Salinigranum rubrum]
MRCAVGCGHVQQGVDVGYGLDTVRGDPAHPVNRGLACGRGVSESADPDGEWLTRPLVREDGELVKTNWTDALSTVLKRVVTEATRDPDSVAVLGSGQQTNEAAYALGKVARGAIGTRHYDANTTLCMASAVTAYYDAFGSDAPPPTYDDIPDADTHLVWGANPAVAHPVMFRWVADSSERGELIVVDPVRTETADVADTHVQPRPGGDYALARAVLARCVETGRIDEAFVDRHTAGFSDLLADLPSVADAAADAGVPVDAVDDLAASLSNPTLLYWGMGINQSVRGTATAGALVDLCLATGNLGPGTGPFSLTGQANSMGARVCSSKGTWPGHRDFEAPDHRRAVAETWDVPLETLPDDAGPGPVGIVESGPAVVWTVATNPVAGLPDATAAREALDEAFVVVQDAFRSETCEVADVVLPAATWGECEGTTMNMERTVSRVRAATETPPGVWTDLRIIATVGESLVPGLFGSVDPAPREVFDEFVSLTAGTPADCSGLSYDRFDAEYAVRWPASSTDDVGGYRYLVDADATDDGDGEERWSFPTPSGNARFSARTPTELPEPVDDDYSLVLTTGREADGYNTGVRSRFDDDLVRARVNPETLETYRDAVAPSDSDDRRTTLVSRRGRVPALLVSDAAVPAGLVWLPIHHPMTNHLTIDAVDPDSDEPNYKQCAVRLAAPSARESHSEPAARAHPDGVVDGGLPGIEPSDD